MIPSFRITHVITGLGTGGAEMMLYKLLGGLARDRFQPEVISLSGDGPMGERIRALDIPVRCLDMRPGVAGLSKVLALAGILRQSRPALVQTWMYHADLAGGLASRLAGRQPVLWGVRNKDLSPERNKAGTIRTAHLCARLSPYLPSRIIFNSQAARLAHAGIGYDTRKMIVIPNGFDLDRFQPDPAARVSVRQELGLAADTLLVGLVARFDPQKDHRNFIQAAGLLATAHANIHYLMCGEGVTPENPALVDWIAQAGLTDRVSLLGRRDDIPRLMAALDLFVSSSVGESFPNVIGEAMACGLPCVVTDAGDSAYIVGETGAVVPTRDPDALSRACRMLLAQSPEQRQETGRAARERVRALFDLRVVVGQYEDLYRQVLAVPQEPA